MAQKLGPSINQIKREGIAGAGVGEHPVTLWLIASIVIVFLYIRRSQIGIDLHPAEEKKASKPAKQADIKLRIGPPGGYPMPPLPTPRLLPTLQPGSEDDGGGGSAFGR